MKRLILILFYMGILFCVQGSVTASDISDHKFQAPIQSKEPFSIPVRLVLPYEIIHNTSAGFSDVRVFDDRDTEVPYVIYAQSRPKETPRSFSWEIINYHHTDTTQIILLKKPKNIDIARDLRMSTRSRDYAKKVNIYSSADQKRWDLLATGSFFDFSSQVDFRKNGIGISKIADTYLKVMLTDMDKPIAGEKIQLQYKDLSFSLNETIKEEIKISGFASYIGEQTKEERFYDTVDIQYPETFIDEDGSTIVAIGKLNIPAEKISLQIKNSYFYRHVEMWVAEKDVKEHYRAVGKGVIYRIPDIKEIKTAFSTDFKRPAYVRLKIINNDNPPLIVESVTIKWIRRNLYFMPERGRTYALYFGGGEVRTPNYELKRMILNQHDKLMGYDEWFIGELHENNEYKPKAKDMLSQRIQKYLFIGLVILIVCGLGFWVFTLSKKITGSDGD